MIQKTPFPAPTDEDLILSIQRPVELVEDEDDVAAELDRPRETRLAFLVLTQCAGRLRWDD